MKIIYDHQAFGMQAHGGVSRYFYEISGRIAAMEDCDVEIVAPLCISEYFKPGDPLKPTGLKVPQLPGTNALRRRANALISSMLLRQRHGVDVFHETYYSQIDCCPKSAKRVLTVYDMTHERLPNFFSATDATPKIKRNAVERADHVICISESTRRDLLAITGISPQKTSVVPLGYTLAAGANMATASRFPANTYILYVGARGGYKNFTNFLRAYSSSPSLRGTFGVVCFGGGEFCLSERKLLASLGLGEDKIVQLPGDDSVLAGLYSRAAVLVYPSLYEGFGIPPLEAMSFDCPVICSNTSSLPEVVGDAAELFDPSEPENIRIAIERVVMSAARTNALIALGRERIKNFSWDRCARETFTVYQRVLGIA